jgi:hypothetical protein
MIHSEKEMHPMSTQLDALTKEVANTTTVEASALALIHNFATELSAAGTDGAALQKLHDTLVANDAALAAAVVANTAPPAAAAPVAAAPVKAAAPKLVITGVKITPPNVTISPGAQKQFDALVAGDPTNDVTWKVEPPTGAGAIGPRGLFTAPSGKAGSSKVVATSVADPTKSATATVIY